MVPEQQQQETANLDVKELLLQECYLQLLDFSFQSFMQLEPKFMTSVSTLGKKRLFYFSYCFILTLYINKL